MQVPLPLVDRIRLRHDNVCVRVLPPEEFLHGEIVEVKQKRPGVLPCVIKKIGPDVSEDCKPDRVAFLPHKFMGIEQDIYLILSEKELLAVESNK